MHNFKVMHRQNEHILQNKNHDMCYYKSCYMNQYNYIYNYHCTQTSNHQSIPQSNYQHNFHNTQTHNP